MEERPAGPRGQRLVATLLAYMFWTYLTGVLAVALLTAGLFLFVPMVDGSVPLDFSKGLSASGTSLIRGPGRGCGGIALLQRLLASLGSGEKKKATP